MAEATSFLAGVTGLPGVRAGFTERIEGVVASLDKWETLGRLEEPHRESVKQLGFDWEQLWRAEQVHGTEVAVVPSGGERMVPGADGLVTGSPGVLLGIYVADCAAVFLADRRTGALGLVHSGKKGTELGIVGRALETMRAAFGTNPGEVVAAIAPCIRPPLYEVDIAAEISRQLREAGVPDEQVTDSGICTGTEVDRYYSYRVEKGQTGRMLALLGRVEGGANES